MVPTEEERLPIRVPVSVRGLNASESFLIPFFRSFPHSYRMLAVFRAGPKPKYSPCSLQTIFLLIESFLIMFDIFLYVLRSILAV